MLALALLGAVAGGAVAPTIGQKFTAVSSLYFDPRQIGLADPGAQSSGPSPEMISTLIDSQVQILTSGNVLRRVVQAMKLDQDPEFTGGRADGAAVIGTLQKALVITREATTYVVSLAATTNDPEKSARLANQVVTSFTEEETAPRTASTKTPPRRSTNASTICAGKYWRPSRLSKPSAPTMTWPRPRAI